MSEPSASLWSQIVGRVRPVLDLGRDQADAATIDETIRAGVEFRGTNLWLLVFATVIASIGLNVNSSAVIIGAMLVSPLMGPIMAVGYAAGVSDSRLLRASLRNMGLAVAFSVLASTVYFALTPLSEARSEILARTSPTIWDVLIALFGGFAGIVGVTRREKSNVIPGVAIATALMPPLCTAGYGIATLQPLYALGALYLFSINSVFIATATLFVVRAMRLPEVELVDERSRQRARRWIGAVVLLTAVPSVWLAFGLVRQEVFVSRAEQFLASAFPRDLGTWVVGRDLDPRQRAIRVTVVGEPVDDDRRVALLQTLGAYGLEGARLDIDQVRNEEIDVATLRAQVAGDLHRDTLVALDAKTREIAALEERLAEAEARRSMLAEVVAELRASYPQATDVAVGTGTGWGGAENHDVLLVKLSLPAPLAEAEHARLVAWLGVRTGAERVELAVTIAEPPTAPAN